MKVKFNLDNMNGINDLTSGKEYDVTAENVMGCVHLIGINNNIDHPLIIVLNTSHLNCEHLQMRAAWEVVSEELKTVH